MKIGIVGDIHWSRYSSILRQRGDKYSVRLENCIKSINFLQCLPNLFSLDLSDNPIENYDILHSYNSYGYFAITPPKSYMEKQILSIKKLNVVYLNNA